MNIQYKIQFHAYWHAGSGLSGGPTADNEVIKTKEGLPFIPGKTLKGLLREAATILNETKTGIISNDFIAKVFGEESVNGTQCHFTNADLSHSIKSQLSKENKAFLFQTIASTKIDDKGQAVTNSLRTMEVTVPLVLYAEILNFPEEELYKAQLKSCIQFIKRMGSKRHRGFGRCDLNLINI